MSPTIFFYRTIRQARVKQCEKGENTALQEQRRIRICRCLRMEYTGRTLQKGRFSLGLGESDKPRKRA